MKRIQLAAAGAAAVLSASTPAMGLALDDITYWVGDGTNRCAMVVDFNDGSVQNCSFAWGYRWNGESPSVTAILNEITAEDARLKMFARTSTYGTFIDAFAYDADADGGTFTFPGYAKSDDDDLFPEIESYQEYDEENGNYIYSGTSWMQLEGTGGAFEDVTLAESANGSDLTHPLDGQWICWRLCTYSTTYDSSWNFVDYYSYTGSEYVPVAAKSIRDFISGSGKVTKSKTAKGKTATWKAVAAKGSVFSRWEGGIVDTLDLSANALRNPALKFKMPAKLAEPKAVFVPIDADGLSKLWLEGDMPLAAGVAVTNLFLRDDSLSYVTAAVAGLPKGMTFNAANLRFGGVPAEDGVYILTVTAKNAAGCQMKQSLRLVVGEDDPSVETPEASFVPCFPLTVIVAAGGGGTASGTGVYASNKVVTVKAAAAKNRVFAGWFTDIGCTRPAPVETYDHRAPTCKVRVPDVRYLVAKFIKKGSGTDPVDNVTCASADESGAVTMMVGVKLPGTDAVTCESASLPSFKATGLPAGVSIDKSTGVIKGVPKKAGTFKAKVTASNASTKKALALTVKVLPLPAWAKGTFIGLAGQSGDDPALARLTVGATGKISGKVAMPGTNWTFTATSFDAGGFTGDATNLAITGKAQYVDAKKRKTYRDFAFTMNAPTNGTWNLSSATGTFGDADFAAHRVIWGDSTAAMWELKANWSGSYRYVTPDGDTMTLKILDSGNVAWTGLLGNGRAVIGSTTLLHEDAALIRTPFAVAYAPAASKKVKSGKTTTTVKYPVFCEVISFKYDGPPPGEPAERRSN